MRAKSPGQNDAVNRIDAEFIHQEARAGIERRFGHLDGADIGVGNGDFRAVLGTFPEHIGLSAPVGDTARGAGLRSRADQAGRVE